MEYVVYIYASKQPEHQMTNFRCPTCARILFSTNSKRIFLTNAYGASVMELPPSTNMIEYKCHSCKSLYTILFQ